MQRVGKTYKVIAGFNPLIEFPAQVYPVFSLLGDNAENARKFLQVLSSEDTIEDFLEITVPKITKLLPAPKRQIFASINIPAVYGFSLSRYDTLFCKGNSEFRGLLRQLLSERERSRPTRDPLCWVEVCRLLDDERLEAVFAGMAVRLLASRSFGVTNSWINHAPLSKLAKARALRILERLQHSDPREEDEPVIRTIALSNSSFVQGELVRVLPDGNIIIRLEDKFYSGPPPAGFVLGKSRVERMDRFPPRYAAA